MFDDTRKRWWALYVLCSGVLMIVLDTTIVNVALPSIRVDLKFTETSLVWVVNAYMLTFGGFLLLGGRLGDLFGHRRLFLLGLILFTAASVGCGVATSQGMLIGARAIQGIGGAVVTAVALSLIMDLFTETGERAKAMGIYGFVCSAGGSVGVLLGGFLTTTLNWHWIFLVNVPIGALVYFACRRLMPHLPGTASGTKLDVAGAITVTTSLMLAVYAVVNGHEVGWRSMQTVGTLTGAVALLVTFLFIESRVKAPLMPLGLFRLRNVATANVAAVLWAAASSDIIATHFWVTMEGVIHTLQALLILGPILAYFVAKRMCLALQKKDREIALHGYESGRIVRLPMIRSESIGVSLLGGGGFGIRQLRELVLAAAP